MITLQKKFRYAGRLENAPADEVAISFDFPAYLFTVSDEKNGLVDRRPSTAIVTWEIFKVLTDKQYQLTPDDTAVLGKDVGSQRLAPQYYMNALSQGAVADLSIPIEARFATVDGIDLGGTKAFDALCLPLGGVQAVRLIEASARTSGKSQFALANRAAFEALRKKIAATSSKVSDGALLALICAMTDFEDGFPVMVALPSAGITPLLERFGTKATAAEAKRVVQLVAAASDALFDFELVVPELQMLEIAGTLRVVRSDALPAEPVDFLNFEIRAECSYASPPRTRRLSFRFSNDVTVAEETASFSLTAGRDVLRNGMTDPVRIEVRGGLDGAVAWSKELASNDSGLAHLNIELPLQVPVKLTAAPKEAELDRSKKLRGQVVTFKSDCALKGALVLIQAKQDDESDWHIVGAGPTDSSGNFTVPYPYGKFAEARAIVSLAPAEPAAITVSSDGADATISDEFLYLLLKNPQCPAIPDDESCDCSSTDTGNRLPDHADLIGSDAYTQDIGGSCVNLSKPNRTISEYAYQAIVRTSDPDVATYTLTRYESGIDTIDVAVLASLRASATALNDAATAFLADAKVRIASAAGYALPVRYFNVATDATSHVNAVRAATSDSAPPITLSVLGLVQMHVDSVTAVLQAYLASDWLLDDKLVHPLVDAAKAVAVQVAIAIDSVGTSVRYELAGGAGARQRRPIALDNPVLWQDAPEPLSQAATAPPSSGIQLSALDYLRQRKSGGAVISSTPSAVPGQDAGTFAQAVSVATGHILHYRAVVKADGYSLGDLIYSLPLAPGQKKEIVVFDSSHSLVGAETQAISQNERLAMGLVSEREITDQLAGSISESMRGSSRADTRGFSAGFGTGAQGSGGNGAFGGSGSVVIGVAGGWAQASSTAAQDSSRDVAQFFGEKLRQSIMQNAEGYRKLNASVVTTVQEGQRYGVTSEVVANHNHCHALTMMYFEVLRHFAVYQELASVEESVFVPLLLTRFTTENVAKWRDVLAPALLPMPSDSYLQPHAVGPNTGRQHPLLKAFDAGQRIRTHYTNVDFPAGSYNEERIQYIKGTLRLRVNLPRPRTRFDRILSFPVVKKFDAAAAATAYAQYASDAASYAAKAFFSFGLYTAFKGPDVPPNPQQFEVVAREAIADAFMRLDANYETVPPAQCMRIIDFRPKTIAIGPFGNLIPTILTELDFFAENAADKEQWSLYSQILGYPDVATMLNAHFRGNLISEWDSIFRTDIAPLVLEKLLDAIRLDQFATDFSTASKYHGGEQGMLVDLMGTTSKSRKQLPLILGLSVYGTTFQALKKYVSVRVESVSINYATSHYNGVLFRGAANDDLLDGTQLAIPENAEEKRNPRKEDRYLAAKLIEHLNANLEYYNKVLWYRLDVDRRYMLLDGFSIQVYDFNGSPLPAPGGLRSLASVVKNEVIAVAGNSLVMPVAPGYRVSGSFISVSEEEEVAPTLLDHYKPITPVPPYRISVPSKGVFAEAVQGACNACEKIETDRLQDWNRYPIGDEPPAINAINVPTPGVTDWRAAFKDFAAPIVNVQNAPAAPAPGAGLAGLAELLGKSGVFKDITGLDANQQNAIRTYLSNQENAKAFAEMAKEMAMQQHNTQNSGKIMDSIASAKQSGDVSKEDAGKLVKDHLQQQIDGGQSKRAELTKQQQSSASPLTRAVIDAAREGKDVKAEVIGSEGGSESVAISRGVVSTAPGQSQGAVPVPAMQQTKSNDCWAVVATMLMSWKKGQSFSVEEVVAQAGQRYLDMYRNDTGLAVTDKLPFVSALNMVAEPPMSVSAQQYADWLATYGPLWITSDADESKGGFSLHARVLTRIAGDVSGDGRSATFTSIDPATGRETSESFASFIQGFEQAVTDNHMEALAIQVVHFNEALLNADVGSTEGGVSGPMDKGCYGAFATAGPRFAAALGIVAHRMIASDVEKSLRLERGNDLFIDDQSAGPINPRYVTFLINKNPAIPDTSKDAIRAGGYGRPDLVTHYETVREFEEIKPNTPSGISQGLKDIRTYADWMESLSLPYVYGRAYAAWAKRIPLFEFKLAGLPVTVSLLVERYSDGLLVYKYCFKADARLLKGAIVAVFILLLTLVIKYIRIPGTLPPLPIISPLPPGFPDQIVLPPIKQPAGLEVTDLTSSTEFRVAFEQLTDDQVHDVVLLGEDSLPVEWSNFTP